MSVTCDVIVIGGGIIGLSVADRLRREGLSVTLLERNRCGQEASWAAAGILRPSAPNRRGMVQQLQRASLDLYPAYCADLHERTGIDPQYSRDGSLELIYDERRHEPAVADARAAAIMPDGSPEWEVIAPEAVRGLEPCANRECRAGLLCRVSAQVRNPRLLQALVAACTAGGVRIEEQTPVRALLIEGQRVAGVSTGRGNFTTGHVVLCAGAWSSSIDPRLDGLVSTHPVRGQILLLDARGCAGVRFTRVLYRKSAYLVPRRDGLVLLGATEEHEAGFNSRNTPGGVAGLIQAGLSLVPGLAAAHIASMWAGLRPGTPDRRPYLGPVPGFDGLIAATGHFRTGLAWAPITAEIVADLIVHGRTERDLSRCLPGRQHGAGNG